MRFKATRLLKNIIVHWRKIWELSISDIFYVSYGRQKSKSSLILSLLKYFKSSFPLSFLFFFLSFSTFLSFSLNHKHAHDTPTISLYHFLLIIEIIFPIVSSLLFISFLPLSFGLSVCLSVYLSRSFTLFSFYQSFTSFTFYGIHVTSIGMDVYQFYNFDLFDFKLFL